MGMSLGGGGGEMRLIHETEQCESMRGRPMYVVHTYIRQLEIQRDYPKADSHKTSNDVGRSYGGIKGVGLLLGNGDTSPHSASHG
jgi:hypothetical protein